MSRLSESELLRLHNQKLFVAEKMIKKFKYTYDEVGELMPCPIVVNQIQTDIKPYLVFLNEQGGNYFGKLLSELQEMGTKYLDAYIHPVTLKINNYISEKLSTHKVFTYIDPIKTTSQGSYLKCIKSKKICSVDDSHFFSLTYPANSLEKTASTFYPLVMEHQFFHKNFRKFQLLTSREIDILRFLASGQNNKSISEQLSISMHTIVQHRKNINRKLEIKSYFELLKYAQAYDLI